MVNRTRFFQATSLVLAFIIAFSMLPPAIANANDINRQQFTAKLALRHQYFQDILKPVLLPNQAFIDPPKKGLVIPIWSDFSDIALEVVLDDVYEVYWQGRIDNQAANKFQWREEYTSVWMYIHYSPDLFSLYPGGMTSFINSRELAFLKPRSVERVLRSPDWYTLHQLDDTEPDRFLIIYDDEDLNAMEGYRGLIYRNDYIIYIYVSAGHLTNPNHGAVANIMIQAEEYFKNAVDEVEANILQSERKQRFTLVHHDPFTTPSGGQSAPGELVATLTDQNGNRVKGQDVYFFKDIRGAEGARFDEVLKFPTPHENYAQITYDQGPYLNWFSKDFYVYPSGYGILGSAGEVKFNYISQATIDYPKLLEIIQTYKSVKGGFYAVTFDKSPLSKYPWPAAKPKIEQVAYVNVEFKGIAAIIQTGSIDSTKPAALSFALPNKDQRTPLEEKPPFYLTEGTVYFEPNTSFVIRWLNGLEMSVRLKDSSGVTEEQKITISYKDAGWFRQFDAWAGNLFVQLGISSLPSLIALKLGTATATGAALSSIPVTLGIAGVFFTYELYKWLGDPVLVVPNSKILFDFDQEMKVYTVEGQADLYLLETGDMVEVGTGKMVTLTIPGQFGEVTDFTDADLSPELLEMKQSMIEKQQGAVIPVGGDGTGQPGQIITTIAPVPGITHGDAEAQSAGSTGTIIALASSVVVLILASLFLLKRRKLTTGQTIDYTAPQKSPRVYDRQAQVKPDVKCSSCGSMVSPGARFCNFCSASLQVSQQTNQIAAQKRFCSQCGSARRPGKGFCSACGYRFTS